MKPVFVIAEAGVNHNGSLQLAKRLIDVAVEGGANAVKFQTFRSESVISRFAPKAQYQIKNTGSSESQLEMVRRLELDVSAHIDLRTYCRQKGIQFLSTPFDLESLDLLTDKLELDVIKIASGEITNLPLLLAAARKGCKLIVSTGMSTIGDIEQALAALAFGFTVATSTKPVTNNAMSVAYRSVEGQKALLQNVSLLHCTSEYPAQPADVNLRAMETIRATFGLPVGYSDHTLGVHIPIAAVALGATIIEKHFTTDRTLPGPDHVASLEPGELKTMVASIRDVEAALGSGRKLPADSEAKNIGIGRKSLVALKAIARGEQYTRDNLTTKRPGTGVTAMRYEDFLGRSADRDYLPDELIDDV